MTDEPRYPHGWSEDPDHPLVFVARLGDWDIWYDPDTSGHVRALIYRCAFQNATGWYTALRRLPSHHHPVLPAEVTAFLTAHFTLVLGGTLP